MKTIQDCIQSINQQLRQKPSQTIITETPRPFLIQKSTDEVFEELCITMDNSLEKKHANSSFQVDKENSEAIWQVAAWLCCDTKFKGDLFKGLIVMGSPGTGKTILMMAISEMLMRNCAKSIRVIPSSTISRAYLAQNQESIESYQRGLLCIDDLGSEQVNIMVFGSNISPVSEVIAGRYSSGRLTLATTNLTASVIEKIYSLRIHERIKEMMNGIVLTGNSRRK